MIKLSIIIPIYNTECYLEQCLESIIHQEFSEIEVICVDDGSTDKSLQILNAYAEKDKRIRVISLTHRGVSAARNAGIQHASGDYIFFIDSDDCLEKGILEGLYCDAVKRDLDVLLFNEAIIAEDDIEDDIVSHYIEYYQRTGNYPEVYEGQEMVDALLRNGDYRPAVHQLIIKTAFIKENRIEFIEGIIHEDNPFTFSLLLKAKKVGFYPRKAYYHRIRRDSIMQNPDSFHNVYSYLISAWEMTKTSMMLNAGMTLPKSQQVLLRATAKHVQDSWDSITDVEKKKCDNISKDEKALLYLFLAMGKN